MQKKLLLVGSNTIHTYNYLELVKDYFDSILLITNEKREGFTLDVHCLSFNLSLSNIRKVPKEIERIMLDFKPTVIHVHQANSYAFYTHLANKKLRIPVILTAWGSDVLLLPSQSWILKKMVQYNLKKADFITSDSRFMADEIFRLSKVKNDVLIANFGIGIQPVDLPKENIIYSNRLHKKLYRIDKVIDAFYRFLNHASNSDWKLVIAATGEETEGLKNQVNQLNLESKVTFVGWVKPEENARWYSKSKVWVSIPESDATAISLLEAMACGCIPIVSNLPANKEWVSHTKTGIIVEDIETDFFMRIDQLDADQAILLNQQKISQEGTKEVNKVKFIAIYNKLHQ
jgi:L-malate glycosyltransferase